MIDFHCHILPGIDDGAKDWEESIAMARCLVGQGVTGVVATPHHIEGYYNPAPGTVLALVEEFKRRLIEQGIDLEVYPGCEAHISPELPELVQEGKVLTVNNGGKYLLVELPFGELPLYTDDVLFRLKVGGVTPIVAHPERNDVFANDLNNLISLIRKGCLVQINAGSFTGSYGRLADKAVRKMVKCRAAHFIGTDLHGSGPNDISLDKVKKIIEQSVGAEEIIQSMTARPQNVIDGQTLTTAEIDDSGYDGLFKRFVGRVFGV